MTVYRVLLVGFGAAGQGFAQIIRDHGARIAASTGADIKIVGVATARRGSAYAAKGLDAASLLTAISQGSLTTLAESVSDDALTMIATRAADVMVELSPTNLDSGEPATSHIKAALNRGLHVVTANKGPAALHLKQLRALAAQKGLFLGIEGTVMAGTPSLRLGWSSLQGCDVSMVRGIVNGTTNYILTQMEQGLDYADALADAQRLGYAEADPTGDVEGHDAAGKAAILANVLMDAGLRPSDVACKGITGITAADVRDAQAAGERWKLIAEVRRTPAGVVASVQPMRLPVTHPLAGAAGATNALTYTTDLLGDVTIIGAGAGGVATGFAVVGDLLAMHRGEREPAK